MENVHRILYFLRWQLYPVVLSLPAHAAFVLRGRSAATSPGRRIFHAWQNIKIHLLLKCGHNPVEALQIVEEIIELPKGSKGVIVECGCFLGGSTAKLSHAAAAAGRELVVCDSFEGLPDVHRSDHTDLKTDFKKGEYLGRLDQVRGNVERYGRSDCVRYVKGWFDESLVALRGTPVICCFWDADLQDSFRACIQNLWQDIVPGAKVFLHDVDRPPVVAVFTDPTWWHDKVGTDPPPLAGAYNGLNRLSPLLGFVTKPKT
jgi:hypothetical protein